MFDLHREMDDISRMGIAEKLASRDTPAGRRYELQLIFWDAMVLCVGCLALALGIVPVLAVVAMLHLGIGALQAISRVVWLIQTPAITAVLVGVLVALGFVLEWLGWATARSVLFTDVSPRGLLVTVVYAAVVGGILESLFAYPGTVSWVVEYKDKYPEVAVVGTGFVVRSAWLLPGLKFAFQAACLIALGAVTVIMWSDDRRPVEICEPTASGEVKCRHEKPGKHPLSWIWEEWTAGAGRR